MSHNSYRKNSKASKTGFVILIQLFGFNLMTVQSHKKKASQLHVNI